MRNQISDEVTNAVQAALGGKPVKRGRNGRAASTGGTRSGKRTAEDIAKQATRILAVIKENPGSRSEQIAKAVGIATSELVLPINKLLEAKEIKKTGKARGTTYTAK